MKIKITRSKHVYIITSLKKNKSVFSLREIGDLIREDHEIEVRCPDDIDYTKETMVKIAFEGVIPNNTNTKYVEIIADYISKAELVKIILNGGYKSYLSKRLRNAEYNGDYYFDSIEESLNEFVKTGGNFKEMKNYVLNTLEELENENRI